MCGFTGMLGFKDLGGMPEVASILDRMTDALIHRGPDDRGTWLDPDAGYAVGFRRLSILDLTPEGHQPMRSASGRFVLVFNGEVYNHLALRRELESLGHEFRGHSDTEVILASVEHWGLVESVKRFWGMFAMALWDRRERRLFLIRDRLGKKPLYYGWQGGVFLFGSELKALRLHPAFQGEVDRDSLSLFLRYSSVPDEYSIYQGIHKLKPGSILEVNPNRPGELGAPIPFWDPREAAERGRADLFNGSEDEALDTLEPLLMDAVALRMLADVPVGVFLSGGIDSSLVAALMQAQSSRPVRTFSIGFNDDQYNEAQHAKAVAQHLGTDHTELYVRPEEAREVIPKLPWIYDEPFSDSSQIPTFLVSQLARKDVTVALSGDGGDEVFGGYNRYVVGTRMLNRTRWVPRSLRAASASALLSVSPAAWDRGLDLIAQVIPKHFKNFVTGERLHKLAGLLTADGVEDLYRKTVSHWPDPGSLVIGGREPLSVLMDRSRWPDLKTPAEIMMYLDLITYLVDDILVKVDRASMAASLETRAPLLDHRVIEFAWTLPLSMKIRGGQGKYLLRRLLDRSVPRELVDRPKQGFGVPIGDWLRGPLREWAEHLLDPRAMRDQGFFRPEAIQEKWRAHLSGARNWQYDLWDVLMFQAWLASQRSSRAA